jgi:hypothetical protein
MKPEREQGQPMKSAVFQISEPDGFARLISVEVASLGDAVELEAALRQRLPRLHVALIGRFDRVELAGSMAEFLDLALAADFASPGRFENHMRRFMSHK